MAINFIKKEDLSHITRTTRQWETTIDRYEIIPKGVLCIELCNDKLTKIKIGNGHLIYEQLPYVSDVNLSDYYTKEETNNLIKDLKAIKIKGEASSLSDLPSRGNEDGDLWFVKKQDPDTHSRYDEYVWYNNKWESFGSSDIDLSEYAKKSYVDTHIQEVQDEIIKIIESGYLHKHDNKNILDHTSAVYNVEKDNKLSDLHNYDDSELREKAHTHLNKNILDQTDAVYNRDKDDKLKGLHNYDDTSVKQRLSTLEGAAHSHSNQDVLNRTTAAFTKEQALTLLDCKDFKGTDGVHDGYHGFVPAPTKDDIGKVLGANGEWVEGGGGGSGDTITEGGGIEITTDPQTNVKTVSVNAGTGLAIDQQTGELYVTSTGGDTIAEGNGIDITTDSQTGVKTISVDIGNGLQFNQNSEIDINTGDGLSINQNNELDINIGEGLSINQSNELNVAISNGLQFDSNDAVEVNVGDGLSINASDEVELDKATTTTIGGVIVGDNLSIDNTGTISADEYTPGEGISIDSNKEVSVKYNSDGLSINASDELELDKATKNSIGGVIVGDNINVSNGTISVPIATDSSLGVVNPTDGLSVDNTGELSVNVGNGLSIDSTNNDINVNPGRALSINNDNEIDVDIATSNSLGVIKVGSGLSATNDGTTSVNTGEGLTVDSNNNLKAKLGDGLQFDENNAIEVVNGGTEYTSGDGIDIDSENEISVKIGNHLSFDQTTGDINVDDIIAYYGGAATEVVNSAEFTIDKIRWTVSAIRSNSGSEIWIQLRYFGFYDDSYNRFQVSSGASTWSDGSTVEYYQNRTIESLIANTERLCAKTWNGVRTFAMTFNLTYDISSDDLKYFRYYTGDDESGRDPVSWTIEVHDKVADTWTQVQTVTGATVPTGRNQWTSYFDLNLPPSDGKKINVLVGDGLFIDSTNNDVNVKIGQALSINNDNEIDVNLGRALSINNSNAIDVDIATGTSLGVVKAGSGLNIDEFGNLSTQAAPYRIGRALSLDDESVRLPSGYAKAKYVENPGGAGKRTGFRPSDYPNAKYTASVSVESVGSSSTYPTRYLCGASGWTGALKMPLDGISGGLPIKTFFYIGNGDNPSYTTTTFQLGERFDFEASPAGGFKINNELVQAVATPPSNFGTYYFTLFGSGASNGPGEPGFKGRIYYFRIYNTDDTLLANFVPAVRLGDNVVGFFNTVNNTFYSSETSTAFTTDMDDLDVDEPDWVLNANIATSNSLGVVKPSTGLVVNAQGALTLDKASASTIGGVKVGNNLSIDSNGVLSANIINYSAGHAIEIVGDLSIDKFRWEITANAGNSMVAFRYFEYSDSTHTAFTIQSGTIEWSDGSTVSYPSGYDETFAGMMENRTKCTVTGWGGSKTLIMTFTLSQSISLSDIAYFRWKTDDYMSGRQPTEFNIYAHDSVNDEWILLKEVTDHSLVPSSGNTWSNYIEIEPEIGPGAINVKYGNGLTLNQNNELEVVGGGGTEYHAGEAISIETIGGLQLTDYSNDTFVTSIASVAYGSIVKAADNSSFTLTASDNDCYTRGASAESNGSYPFNVKASTKYRFAWDSADPTVHGKVYVFENGLYDAMIHEIDQYDSSYLEFTTSANTTFIQARFGVMYAGDSITYSNVRLYEVIEDEDQYDEISVKYGNGLTVNERNELEVRYGNGLALVSNSQYRPEYYFNTQVQCKVHTDNYYTTHSSFDRTFQKTTTEPALCCLWEYGSDGYRWVCPLIVGTTATSVQYTAIDLQQTVSYQNTFQYLGETWYTSGYPISINDADHEDKLGNLQYLEAYTTTSDQIQAAKDLIDLALINTGSLTAKLGNGLQFDQTGAIEVNTGNGLIVNASNKIELDKATSSTLGGVIVGNGLTVTSDGTISTATGKAYIAGEGINMSSSQYEFSAENEQYLFRSQVTCELHGDFNREFQKTTDGTALGMVWNVYDSGTLWSGPVFVGLSSDSVKYTTNSTTYSALGTFSYLGKTWYYSDTQMYVSNIDGTDYDGNMAVDTETYASTSEIVDCCKSLIDRARVILKVDEISLLPATEDTLGGIKIGEGLSIDDNGVASATVYEEGQGITFETTESEDGFNVKNKEYYFTDTVSCQLNGDYGPRTFTRVSTDPCLLAIVQVTANNTIWSGPLAVGLTENSAKYSNSYDGRTIGPDTSFDYKGYTWYLTYNYGMMNSSGVDLMGNVPSIDMRSIDVSDRNDLYLMGQALIDAVELIQTVVSMDVWNTGTGWLNGAYNDSQSDQFWTNWYYTYHSKQNEYLEVPAGAVKMRLIGISNENDSRLQGGGVDCFDSSHHHFATVGCITDEWFDIPGGTVYLQFGVKWNESNDRTISSSDIKSVTLQFWYSDPKNNAITAKLGDGLTFDENDAITLDESIKLIIHCVGDPLT